MFRTLACHKLPLTNCYFNKSGDSFITGSYDHTCMIWSTETGEMLQKLVGHKGVVYALSFNLPYGDKVGTGSFDTTAKLWSVKDGSLLSTYKGHTAEIVCLAFDPQSTYMATGSMDKTAKVWNLETNQLTMDIDVSYFISLGSPRRSYKYQL